MIKSVEIENYKNFKHLKMENFNSSTSLPVKTIQAKPIF